MQPFDTRGTIEPVQPVLIELRGPSGKLYGMLDRQSLIIEFKRNGERAETIDLKPYFEAAARTK